MVVIEIATLGVTALGIGAGIYGVRKAGEESEARQKYWSSKVDKMYDKVKEDFKDQ